MSGKPDIDSRRLQSDPRTKTELEKRLDALAERVRVLEEKMGFAPDAREDFVHID